MFHAPNGNRDRDMTMEIDKRTLAHLEWERLLNALAKHTSTAMGYENALCLDFLEDIQAVRRRYGLVSQAMGLLVRNINPPFKGAPAVGEHLVRASKGGILEPENLIDVGRLISSASALRRFHGEHQDLAPGLWEMAGEIVEVSRLEREIDHTFDEVGAIKDSASDDLRRLRKRVQSLQEELKTRLQELMIRADIVQHLQESYYTLREDRYVLPVKASDRGRVPGIVHGASSSGATVFVEPQALVELNNRLRLCQFEVEEEERRILSRLTAMVVNNLDAITMADSVVTSLDLLYAAASLGLELGANIPTVSDDGEINLLAARHPYLVLGGVAPVVPNNISISSPSRVMIISGANTGGKTVTLKTTGLFALMVKAGLPITAAPDSVFPFFQQVLADIGDEQSISQSLSTFSGHLKSINSFLPHAGEGTLMLLDELVVGTDPEEGSALAQSILEYLAETGSTVVVTTHYERLKTLAYTCDRFCNASVGFNPDTLTPTFMLELGIPGSSSPISIGKRLGLLPQIVERAADLVSGDTVRIEKLVAAMGQDRERMREQEAETRRALVAARKALAEADAEKAAYERKRRELVSSAGDEAVVELRKARDEARAMVRELQGRSRAENFGFRDAAEARQRVLELNSMVEQMLARENGHQRGIGARSADSNYSLQASAAGAGGRHFLRRGSDGRGKGRVGTVGGTGGGTEGQDVSGMGEGLWGSAQPRSLNFPRQADETLKPGARVIVGTMGCAKGIVHGVEADRKRAVVLVGSMKATVGFSDLYLMTDERSPGIGQTGDPLFVVSGDVGSNLSDSTFVAATGHGRKGSARIQAGMGKGIGQGKIKGSSDWAMEPVPSGENPDFAGISRAPEQRPAVFQLADNTLDLRGARVEEALESLERFLDGCIRKSITGAVIIHGHGTGALKRAVRDQLRQSSYISGWRVGEREEGGDGVSVVYLSL